MEWNEWLEESVDFDEIPYDHELISNGQHEAFLLFIKPREYPVNNIAAAQWLCTFGKFGHQFRPFL